MCYLCVIFVSSIFFYTIARQCIHTRVHTRILFLQVLQVIEQYRIIEYTQCTRAMVIIEKLIDDM